MTTELHRRIDRLRKEENLKQCLSNLRGIEKEGLRVDNEGKLALTPHPEGLGSPLTNSSITTDFSEGLLELVTTPHASVDGAYEELADLHQFTYQKLGDETIWAASMPCVVPDDDAIPIANYGTSNVGRMKRIYRIGLGHRYGRAMQTIAGVHYNYSLPEELWTINSLFGESADASTVASSAYMALTRNFHRHCWLLMYLFGASPAVCQSFLTRTDHGMQILRPGTFYHPYATSLRMSDIGYQNRAQESIYVDLNSVEAYARSLIKATGTAYSPYEAIGVQVDGKYRQLNANLLQIENEYYAVIRPKRVAKSGEKPSCALLERGVEYVEVRCLDIDPFELTGVSRETMRFVDVFCLFCLLDSSEPINTEEFRRIRSNRLLVAKSGRQPGLQLDTASSPRKLSELADELLDRVAETAELLDAANAQDLHASAVAFERSKVAEPSRTPSARVLAQMEENDEGFYEFGDRISREHATSYAARSLAPQANDRLSEQARQSIADQRVIEAGDTIDFDTYLARYLAS